MAGRGLMPEQSEIERLVARRVTLIHRLDLITQGAQLKYDDGSPVDMVSEKSRLQDEVARLDRRIAVLGPAAGQA